MNLKIMERDYAVCQLPPEANIPDWALPSSFFSISRTESELSIVCEKNLVPSEVKCEVGWRIFKVGGTLDFSLTGVLASIASPLAQAKVSIFAISTYDTDYVLVKQESLERATEALRSSGFTIS